jgi:CBS-domain-containing membrane protein
MEVLPRPDTERSRHDGPPPVQALSPRRQAGEAMTGQVVTVAPETPFNELARLLRHHRIGAVRSSATMGRVLGTVTVNEGGTP